MKVTTATVSRTLTKALTLLEYLIRNGSERSVEDGRDHIYQIRTPRDTRTLALALALALGLARTRTLALALALALAPTLAPARHAVRLPVHRAGRRRPG